MERKTETLPGENSPIFLSCLESTHTRMTERRKCGNCGTYELQAVYVRESNPDEHVKWGQGRRKQKWIRIGTVCGYCGSFFPNSEREAQREKKIKDWKSWRTNGPPPAVIETKNYS